MRRMLGLSGSASFCRTLGRSPAGSLRSVCQLSTFIMMPGWKGPDVWNIQVYIAVVRTCEQTAVPCVRCSHVRYPYARGVRVRTRESARVASWWTRYGYFVAAHAFLSSVSSSSFLFCFVSCSSRVDRFPRRCRYVIASDFLLCVGRHVKLVYLPRTVRKYRVKCNPYSSIKYCTENEQLDMPYCTTFDDCRR